MPAIHMKEGDMQVINLKEDGDGKQDRLLKLPAGKRLRELLAFPRLAGYQPFALEYKDTDCAQTVGGTQMARSPSSWPSSGLAKTQPLCL